MALDRLTADVAYISKLDNYPPDDPGMDPDKLKLLFDQGSLDIKNFLNSRLIPQIEEQLVSNAENAQLAEEKAAEAAGFAEDAEEWAMQVAGYAVNASNSAVEAAQSAASASVSAAQAQGYADSARESADSAAISASIASAKASEATASKEAIENLSVSVTGLPAGSEPAVTKIVEDGIVTLVFSIPEGKKGDTGPQGPPGPKGEDAILPFNLWVGNLEEYNALPYNQRTDPSVIHCIYEE